MTAPTRTETVSPVRLEDTESADPLLGVLEEARAAAGDVECAMALASRCGRLLPVPGTGATTYLWGALASLAAVDLTVARTIEPHLDALAILEQAGVDQSSPDDVWGVFAAEHPQHRLVAHHGPSGWTLDGVKAWCSLADRLTRAVVTAYTSPSTRRAFAMDLRDPRVTAEQSDRWAARGLRDVVSLSISCAAVPAVPVGPDDWYLTRPGFAWGGAGVAACWFGGAVGLLRALRAAAGRREPDQIALMHLGAVDAGLAAARALLAQSARKIDMGQADGAAGALMAARVRSVVADAAESTISSVGHALGPAPLTGDAEHAARVADLQVYLRQHHAERDSAAMGRLLLDDEESVL